MTAPIWPAPPPRRGAKIRHSWRCSRSAGIGQTTRRAPADGAIIEVDICLECDVTDMAERLLAERPDPGPAAA